MPEFARQQNQTQSSHLVCPTKPNRAGTQPAHFEDPLLTWQQALGNQAVQRLLHSEMLQAKLTINEPRDQYEQEADRVAEQVMQMPEPGVTPSTPLFSSARMGFLQRKCACSGTPGPDGECAECREKRLALQRRSSTAADRIAVPPMVHDVLQKPGQALDPATRDFMEPRFGHDFSQVRVHTDVQATETAQAVNAMAYTVGRDVVFGAGQYAPETRTGQQLIAHELAHVVQQAVGPGSMPSLQRDFWDDEEEEGVFDWISEQVEGAADWASETGSEVIDWATETGGVVDDVVKWAADIGLETGIPYPHEGDVVCTEDGLCWQTRCEYPEGGEEVCHREPYDPGPPKFGEGEAKEGDIQCDESNCLEYRCGLSVDGKWDCQWYSTEPPCSEAKSFKEEALADSPEWCLDTDFSPITHPADRCYRRIIHPYLLDDPVQPVLVCPPSDQICFRPDCRSYSDPDRAGLADSKTNGQCEWAGYCVAQHIGVDVIPAVLGKLWHKIVGQSA